MKSLFRVVVTAAVCVGAATLAAAATPSNVLNKLEVQTFVSADTPIANLSLASYFNGLAEQFFDEASQ